MSESILNQITWNEQGLVAAIAQDAGTGRVLMMAWMNADALLETLQQGYATYWSRSRQQLWRKGESSGNRQKVQTMELDCDGDAVLLKVDQEGGIACHTGRNSCFYRAAKTNDQGDKEWTETEPVLKSPQEMYSND
jgi:phosphoribosyl-AMP cyclohydrolase|tara:strand:- start:12029 stop:12436 length:408 start_codon:yes stop_codon:yes gene_type:complete